MAMKMAEELNALPPLAVRWTKLSVNKWIKHQLNLILDASIAYEMLSINSQGPPRGGHGLHREAQAGVQGPLNLRATRWMTTVPRDWNALSDDEFRRAWPRSSKPTCPRTCGF
jgi:hypothetical protein